MSVAIVLQFDISKINSLDGKIAISKKMKKEILIFD